LDHLEHLVALLEVLEEARRLAEGYGVGVVVRGVERLPPRPVHPGEALALGGELAHDVLAREDRLEVHPGALALEPLFEDVGHQHQQLLPLVDPLGERALERAEGHRLGHHDVVVEQLLDLVEALEHVGLRLAVLDDLEVDALPLRLHLVERLRAIVKGGVAG
jgi:hypothetical protein